MLLLDDIGADEHVTPFVRQQMTRLVDYRLRQEKRTLFATNLLAEEMGKHMGGRIGSRLFDTRAEQVKIVAMTSTDYRKEVEVPARPHQPATQRS